MTNPRGVPIPPQPRLDRRDSGVTAAVWGKEKYLTNPRGVPIPPRPRLDRRNSGVTAAVWGKEKYLTTQGASLSLRGPNWTGGTRV